MTAATGTTERMTAATAAATAGTRMRGATAAMTVTACQRRGSDQEARCKQREHSHQRLIFRAHRIHLGSANGANYSWLQALDAQLRRMFKRP
jgi:hypothetical protein